MNCRTREAVFIKSNQSQHRIRDFRATNQNAGFEFMLDLPKISGASIVLCNCLKLWSKIQVIYGEDVTCMTFNACFGEMIKVAIVLMEGFYFNI